MNRTHLVVGTTTLALTMGLASTTYSKETTAEAPVATETAREPTSRRTAGEGAGWARLSENESTGHPWGATLVIFGVLAAAGVTSLVLRKKHVFGDDDIIDVIASKTVAPRTKVVLLSARNREVLITVTDKGATLLTEWLADEAVNQSALEPLRVAPSPEPVLRFEAPVEVDREPEALLALSTSPRRTSEHDGSREPTPRSHSEAVAGLLELRKKTQRTPPRGNAVAKVAVQRGAAYQAAPAAWPEGGSQWTRELMAQLATNHGGKA